VALKKTAETLAEIDKSWKSYTCFSADYLKKRKRKEGRKEEEEEEEGCLEQNSLNAVKKLFG